jgi:hypothetical protein
MAYPSCLPNDLSSAMAAMARRWQPRRDAAVRCSTWFEGIFIGTKSAYRRSSLITKRNQCLEYTLAINTVKAIVETLCTAPKLCCVLERAATF